MLTDHKARVVVRTSIILSGLFGYPLSIANMRAGRSKPGLAAQHVASVNLLVDVCNGSSNGALIDSSELEFV